MDVLRDSQLFDKVNGKENEELSMWSLKICLVMQGKRLVSEVLRLEVEPMK